MGINYRGETRQDRRWPSYTLQGSVNLWRDTSITVTVESSLASTPLKRPSVRQNELNSTLPPKPCTSVGDEFESPHGPADEVVVHPSKTRVTLIEHVSMAGSRKIWISWTSIFS